MEKTINAQKVKPFNCKEKITKSVKETQAIQRREQQGSVETEPEGSSSEEEHKTNALASGAEEGRDKLR